MTDQSRPDSRTHWIDVTAAVLLALATVATAWSGYQAARWNGEQAKAGGRANATRIESTRAAGLANTQTQLDVGTFIEWVNAYAHKETALAKFYFDRFRPEFRPAVEAWVATKPLTNPSAPLTPFRMPQYRLAEQAKADLLQAESEQWALLARSYIQRSTNYVLGVVLFAAALFFAGMSMSGKLPSRRIRLVLFGLGVAVFIGTIAWIASSPVSVSV
jgi:hypothetical protein